MTDKNRQANDDVAPPGTDPRDPTRAWPGSGSGMGDVEDTYDRAENRTENTETQNAGSGGVTNPVEQSRGDTS